MRVGGFFVILVAIRFGRLETIRQLLAVRRFVGLVLVIILLIQIAMPFQLYQRHSDGALRPHRHRWLSFRLRRR